MADFFMFGSGLFILAAACYLLFITSDPLEEVGGRLGKLLRLPEDVIASTFQAAATSGPEIVMAILAATPFIASEVWGTLKLGERACSGTLNMAFSAMDNLLGIGAVAIVFMIRMGKVNADEVIPAKPSTIIGLLFYIIASGAFALFILDSTIKVNEAWFLMVVGVLFVLSQFIIPTLIGRYWTSSNEDDDDDDEEEETVPGPISAPIEWSRDLAISSFTYAFLVFALIVFVREALGATFNMAMASFFSVGGILIMFTSYVSSFPEFMMAYRYTIADKKSELLGMLFGSNVIDLAFAGFRAMWLHKPMDVYTTGLFPQLLTYYIWALPILAVLLLMGFSTKMLKWKHAYPLIVFYVIYIVSGLILL